MFIIDVLLCLLIISTIPGEGSYTDQTLERLKFDTGLETVQAASIGVYHYKVVESGQSFSTCTIISRGGPKVGNIVLFIFVGMHFVFIVSMFVCVSVCRYMSESSRTTNDYCQIFCCSITVPFLQNHTIHVTDQGFEPKVVTIHPGDRVWWVWQEGSKQHNIIQVNI